MALSPMMQQYLATKEAHPDCILFYRLGDFYEMFFEDAQTVSRELELTLTGKNCGLEERAPMCGVPFHSAETYIARLIEKGYKVAVCEQVEDPKQAKGLVRREVVRIVTPGTVLAPEELEETRNNYLLCVVALGDRYGITLADISTGECLLSEISDKMRLLDEIQKFRPAEILCNAALQVAGLLDASLQDHVHYTLSVLEDRYFDDEACEAILQKHFSAAMLKELGMEPYSVARIAAGALFQYLYETQKSNLAQMVRILPYSSDQFMLLDHATRRNLELIETMRDKQKKGSLLGILDRTKTAMGARLLRKYLEQPLIRVEEIRARHAAVDELVSLSMVREEMREYLQPVYDLERLASRIAYASANPHDLLAFKSSLDMLPFLKQLLGSLSSPLLLEIEADLDALEDVCLWIAESIREDAPLAMHEGRILRDGYHEKVDAYREAQRNGKQWLVALEEEEREKTGIRTLRIKSNKVFGYCIEVTNSFKDKVPEHYIRKQTLTGSERYTTERLQELEETVLGAEEKLASLEYALFCEIRERVASQIARIQQTARALAMLDVLCSLATVAAKRHYVRPVVHEKGTIEIRDGRHPVVENMLGDGRFVENDTVLDLKNNRLAIITGPNMAGKSTYMRQSALIVLMAQMGSFVPASSASIGVVDRIFTRVGASDDLASGQSTFMLEMNEVAHILRNATAKSLLILDEIGRGTSTFDGLSIAWAVIEHIADPKKIGAKTLFATHYHELTELEGKLPGVKNYCIAVKEKGEDIVFLRKIVQGGADKSYGIQVARLAGLPESVLQRARELVEELSRADITAGVRDLAAGSAKATRMPKYDTLALQQMSLFDTTDDRKIIQEIHDLELQNLTPLEALNFLHHLQSEIQNRW